MRGQGRGRGRGRGGGRGHGAHRRGRGGRGGNRTQPEPANDLELSNAATTKPSSEPLDINKIDNLKDYFVGTAEFEEHYTAQLTNVCRYAAGMAVLEKSGVEVSANARVRALAAAWSRRDHQLADSFLKNRDQFGLPEVLKALTMLDSSRRVRVEEKKLKRLQHQNGGKVKPALIGKFKSNIDNLNATKPKFGSVSGALCKRLKVWTRSFTADQLEYYALHFPTEPWRKLADICHFNPKKDFPNLQWFLPFCYGSSAPEGSIVHKCHEVNESNVNELLKEFAIPYIHIRELKEHLTPDSKAKISATDKFDQVIWWYEDLQSAEVDAIISNRLDNGAELSLPYGKLMERLLTMELMRRGLYGQSRYLRGTTPTLDASKAPFVSKLLAMAEKRLKQISLALESPVVVIGDRSGSMEVAIRTATIIASILTAITSARLVFFDTQNMDAPFIPTDTEKVIEMAVTTRTGGATAPAASLFPFYDEKTVVKTFIIVTDEQENNQFNGYRFAPLFKKYREEVYDAKLVFVSFLSDQHETGQMVQELHDIGVTENIMQFKFDVQRPDLTKLDKLFGLLSADSQDFETEVKDMEAKMLVDGIDKFLIIEKSDQSS